MASVGNRRWLIFWAVFCIAAVSSVVAYGATVRLWATVTFALMDHLSNAPLVDGSVVYIMGSTDDVADPPMQWGGTNSYIANSTTGDDAFIGEVRIGDGGVSSNGTFFTLNYTFDTDEIQYLYLRFFEYTSNSLVQGSNIWWNTSPTTTYTNHPWDPGVVLSEFAGNYAATNRSNFVVIPEPGVGGLVLLCGGLLFAASMSRDKKSKNRVKSKKSGL